MSVEEVMCDFLSVHKSRKNCKVLTRFKPATLKVFCIVYFQNSTWAQDTDQQHPVRFFFNISQTRNQALWARF